jgi:hypothetical protein
MACDGTRARDELAFSPVRPEAGIVDTRGLIARRGRNQ